MHQIRGLYPTPFMYHMYLCMYWICMYVCMYLYVQVCIIPYGWNHISLTYVCEARSGLVEGVRQCSTAHSKGYGMFCFPLHKNFIFINNNLYFFKLKILYKSKKKNYRFSEIFQLPDTITMLLFMNLLYFCVVLS